jgi:hypothetical protein
MFNINLFLIILSIFILFCIIQIYFYYKKYTKKQEQIKKIESFENTLVNINNNSNYILDDKSLENLLHDYENFKVLNKN